MSVVSGRRTRRTRRPEIDGSVLRWPGAASRFALFGEVMWTGVLMAIVEHRDRHLARCRRGRGLAPAALPARGGISAF